MQSRNSCFVWYKIKSVESLASIKVAYAVAEPRRKLLEEVKRGWQVHIKEKEKIRHLVGKNTSHFMIGVETYFQTVLKNKGNWSDVLKSKKEYILLKKF